jgi:hypothetical protein
VTENVEFGFKFHQEIYEKLCCLTDVFGIRILGVAEKVLKDCFEDVFA